MATRFSRQILIRAAAMMMFLHIFATAAMARPDDLQYTKERPLVIVADWNFAPYEYSNDKGEPEGYHIDVLKTILHQLDIPFVFKQKEWSLAVKTFDDGKADLIIECLHDRKITSSKAFYSRKTLAPYKVKVAYKKGARPITKLSELRNNDVLMLKKYDYASIIVVNRNDVNKSQLNFSSPKESMHKLNSSTNAYFVWGEMPLQRMIKEFNLTDIVIGDIDIPGGDMRFVSHDQKLIDKIDDQFARLEQSGTIHQMKLKWFHPERREDNASPVVLIIIILSLIIMVAIFVANHFMAARIKKTTQFSAEKNKIMKEALNMSGNFVLRLNLVNPHVYNVHGNHLPPEGMNADEYLARIHPDDRKNMQDYTNELREGQNRREGQAYRWNAGTEEKPEWKHLYNRSIIERDDNGKVINIISTLTDIMADEEQEEMESELTAKYSNIFEMSIIGLLLFNRDGLLENANAKARELLKFKNVNDRLYYNKNIFDSTLIREALSRNHIEETHFCTHITLTERNVDEYVEMRLRPLRNDEGELVYIIMTIRPISSERDIYLKSKENNDKLQAVNNKIAKSEDELRYLLKESSMRVWRSTFSDRQVTFYQDLRNPELQMSLDDFVKGTYSNYDRQTVLNFVEPPVTEVTPKSMVIAVKDIFSDNDVKRWYSINRIPEYDNDGNVRGCFGLIRDISELIEAQLMLKKETQRANESEQQKSVFLANMSHEIRTPLNAIVGFCDLLQSIDSPDDRKEFIRIIRNNCNMLLHLINDILIISSMDSSGLSIEPHNVDFAESFDDVCATFTQQIAEKGLQFIQENPYKSLITEIDDERIQQVIVNFITNAIKHTQSGHIRVGYKTDNGGLQIYCEDTGSGIPKEKSEDIFKRFVKLNDFVQGTGLGLSICKAIADSCKGNIGVDSELGKGSRFWIWIPCEIIKEEQKKA